MKRRLLSLILVVAMLLSLVTISASAVDGVTVSLSAVSYTDTNATSKYLKETGTVTSAGIGDKVAIKVTLTNGTDSALYFSGYNLTLNYDKNVFETTDFEWESEDDSGTTGPIAQASKKDNGVTWAPTVNITTAGVAKWAATNTSYVKVDAGGSTVIGYLLLKVKSDVESMTSKVSFSSDADSNYVKSAASSSATHDSKISDAVFGTPASVTISGVLPTLDKVELSGTALGEDNTVNVAGGDAADQILQAKAVSAKGTDITGNVTWSLTKPVDVTSYTGVTCDTAGKVTIQNSATAGTYTLTATPKSGAAQGSAKSVTFTVARAAETAASIAISGGVETVYLPGSVALRDGEFEKDNGESGKLVQYWEPTAFAATVTNQYGEPTSTIPVEWSFVPAAGQTLQTQYRDKTSHDYCTASGCEHANCEKYSYINETGLEISESGHLMLTNSCTGALGTATIQAKAGDKTATKTVTVAKAPAQITAVTLTAKPDSADIPADGAADTTCTYAVEVKDQYGTAVSNPTVEWSITPAVEGVSIANGVLTVTNAAKNAIAGTQSFTVTAKSGGKTATTTVTVARAASQPTGIALYKDSAPLNGTTDTVTIPAGETGNAYTYTAKVLDQYGAVMTDKTATLTLTPASATGVSFENGKLTVSKTAAKDSTHTLKVSCTGLTDKTVTITLKDIEITEPTVTIKTAPTYGDSWSDIVTAITGGSASLNGSEVDGSFYLKTADKPNAGKQSYQIYFKSNDGQYDVLAKSGTVDVVKKDLTVTAEPKTITYGEAGANNGVTYSGFAAGETSSILSGELTYSYNAANGGGGAEYTATSPKGTYYIIPAGLTSADYAITFVAGTLTVQAKTLTDAMVSEISLVTYKGTAWEPNITVTDSSVLTKDTDYTVSYGNNINAGTATAAITGKGNYTGMVNKTFTIEKAALTIQSATFAEKTYNGDRAATVTGVTFSGLQNSETLLLGTDYTAVGEFAQANVGTLVGASVTVTLKDTAKAKNYVLTAATQDNAGSAQIKPVQTTLTIAAANAAYTGAAYAESNITKTSNVETVPTYTYYADNNGVKAETPLGRAPKDAGTYWVSGHIAASGNNSAATSEAVKFSITKVPLTVTAADRTITYGDAPDNAGVSYSGFVNSETLETSDLGGSIAYTYSYTQYGNVGEYTIIPNGLTSDNYAITFANGKLTVDQKEIGLTWSDVTALYFDKTTKRVTAAATGAVNSDEIGVTVVGGTQTDIGSYTAKVTGLTGTKADNYKLPAELTKDYEIQAALVAVTVMPATIAATIDHQSLKVILTGYRAAGDAVTLTATDAVSGSASVADGKVIAKGVEYTVDQSGVVVNDSSLTITEGTPGVTVPSEAGVEEGYAPDPTASGLGSAAAGSVIEEAKKNAAVASVEVTLEIEIKSYTTEAGSKEFKMEITPKVTYKDSEGNLVGTSATISNSTIKAPVTIKIKLPSGMVSDTAARLFAKHLLSSGKLEYLPVKITSEGGAFYAEWQQGSFSEVTLVTDARTADVAFTKADGSVENRTLTPADIGTALPTDAKSGSTFNGWTITVDGSPVSSTHKTLTDDLLTALDVGTDITAAPSFTANTPAGGGGGGSSTYAISVDKAQNGSISVSPKNASKGDTVTVTVAPDKGYTLETLTVLDKNGKEITVTAKDGKFTFTMPASKVSVKATFMDDNTMLNFFVDVPADAYYYEAVLWAVKNGITTGINETEFGPELGCTRAQIVTFLRRAAGCPEPKSMSSFSDVPADSFYAKAVAWAVENNITSGIGGGKFAPDEICTRAQSATFLYRAAGSPAVSGSAAFSDVGTDTFYANAVAWAEANGITGGIGGGLFGSELECTRAQIVTFLYRSAK